MRMILIFLMKNNGITNNDYDWSGKPHSVCTTALHLCAVMYDTVKNWWVDKVCLTLRFH